MDHRNELIMGLENRIFVRMSTVPLVRAGLDSSYKSIDDKLISNALGVTKNVVAITVHLPKHLAKHIRNSVTQISRS